MRSVRLAGLSAALLIGPLPAHGQGGTPRAAVTPRIGEAVRVRSMFIDPRRLHVECEGTLTALAGDTLILGAPRARRACPVRFFPADEVQRVRVARGNRGSRLGHAALGLLIGGVAGGVAGRIAIGDGCIESGCDDGGLAIGIITVLGVLSGASVGTIVGAVLPAGTRWVSLPGSPPVRVAPR